MHAHSTEIQSLLAKVKTLGGYSSDEAALMAALQEYIRHREQEQIISLFGTIDYYPDHDYKKHRQRRPLP